MENWITGMFNLFGYKKKRRNTIWFSLIGVSVSAVAALLGITQGRRIFNIPGLDRSAHDHEERHHGETSFAEPNLVKDFASRRNVNLMDNAALAEFSDEILSNALKNDRK